MIKSDIQLRLELNPNDDFITLFAKSPILENIMKRLSHNSNDWTLCEKCQEKPHEDNKEYSYEDRSYCGSCGYHNPCLDNYTRIFEYNTYYEINQESDFHYDHGYRIKNWSDLVRTENDETKINLSILRMVGLGHGVKQQFSSVYTDKELQAFTRETQKELDKLIKSIQFELKGITNEFKIKMEYNEK